MTTAKATELELLVMAPVSMDDDMGAGDGAADDDAEPGAEDMDDEDEDEAEDGEPAAE